MEQSPSRMREGLGVGLSMRQSPPDWPTSNPSRMREGSLL